MDVVVVDVVVIVDVVVVGVDVVVESRHSRIAENFRLGVLHAEKIGFNYGKEVKCLEKRFDKDGVVKAAKHFRSTGVDVKVVTKRSQLAECVLQDSVCVDTTPDACVCVCVCVCVRVSSCLCRDDSLLITYECVWVCGDDSLAEVGFICKAHDPVPPCQCTQRCSVSASILTSRQASVSH